MEIKICTYLLTLIMYDGYLCAKQVAFSFSTIMQLKSDCAYLQFLPLLQSQVKGILIHAQDGL